MTVEAEAVAPPQAPDVSSLKLLATLGIAATLSGIVVALVFQFTLPIIQENKRLALEAAVFRVLPGATKRETFSLQEDGALTLVEGEADRSLPTVYAGYDDGKLIGVAIEAKGQGYQDVVRILYGYDPQAERIIGMKLMESKETPGLGDKIGKDETFLKNFKELDVRLDDSKEGLLHPIEVVKHGKKTDAWQIDGITGATISSRAVGDMLLVSGNTLLPMIARNVEILKAGNS